MGKKTCQKFITITAIAMFVVMVAFVATTFITVDVKDYTAQQASSEFINGINDGSIKLGNEDYNLSSVSCVVDETGEKIDLSAITGSDAAIKRELVERMDYKEISSENRANGDEVINITADSDKTFNLSWESNNSLAKMLWFPKHPTAKDFLDTLKRDYYLASGVEYDINDVVLFPVIMFVFAIAGAILSVVFRKYGFFLIFPIFWSIIGLMSYICGYVGLTVPQFFIYNVLKSLSPTVYTIQFVLVVLVLVLSVVSIIFRRGLKNAIKAEEAAYRNNI